MRKPYLIILPILLSACGPGQNDPGPGGVTVGEAQALDDAAAMLDEQNAAGTAPPAQPAPPLEEQD
ncbi:MAG: hypothetical protein U5J78_02200 [Parasphingorhabdus sp.]|nr:hypothetical protein [Parasphingorhabdus sp.]